MSDQDYENTIWRLDNQIEKLEAEHKALREALEAMVEMVEMGGFGKAYAMDLAKAALQEQGDE